MKRLIWLLILCLSLAACQKAEPTQPTESAQPEPSTATPEDQTTPDAPSAPESSPEATPLPPPPEGVTLHPALQGTLGSLPVACAGYDVRLVADDLAYVTGRQVVRRDAQEVEQACVSTVDLTTGEVTSWDLPVAGPILSDGQSFYTGGSLDGQRFLLFSLPYGETLVEAPLAGPLDEIQLVGGKALVLADGAAHVFSLDEPGQLARVPGVQALAAQEGGPDLGARLVLAGRTDNGQLFVGVYDPANPAGEPLAYRESLPPGGRISTVAIDAVAERVYLIRQLTEGQGAYALDVLYLNDLSTVATADLESPGDLVADPARGRLYLAGDQVMAYEAETGQALGPVFSVPPGEPEGFVSVGRLRLNPADGRLYLSYAGFDGDQWLAVVHPDTGESMTNLPLPSGPWRLTSEGDVLATDGQTLLRFDGACTCQDPTQPCPPCPPLRRVSLTRRPQDAVVSPTEARLFVADAGGDLHILSSLSLEEVGALRGVGSYVALDPGLNQFYVGDRYSGGISVFDLTLLSQAPPEGLADLEPVGFIPQPGRPIVSPANYLVYILEESVYRASGATLDLITWRTTRDDGCTGCPFPTDVIVDPNSGLTATTLRYEQAGKPAYTQQATVDPRNGRAYVALTTGGYQPVHHLLAFPDLNLKKAVQWIDGIYGPLTYNPVADQLYLLASGRRLLRLHGESLELLGDVDLGAESRGLTLDPITGRFYLAQGWQIEIFDDSTAPPPPEPVDGLPEFINSVVPSPNFAEDRTIFASAYDWEADATYLYRSTNDGVRWQRIRGGLPFVPSDLVWAPNGRLYAAMGLGNWQGWPQFATWGQGVYVSDDGGGTWRPDNAGLAHLRVTQLQVQEDNLYALSASTLEPASTTGGPTIWMQPLSPSLELTRTVGWVPVEVPETDLLGLTPLDQLYTYTQQVQAWWHALRDVPLYQGVGADLERSDDDGLTWKVVGSGPSEDVYDVLPGLDSRTLYWIDSETLWRSTNSGRTWTALRHPGLGAGGPIATAVTDVDGTETLFLGTRQGRVLIVPVDEAEWE